MVSGRNRREYIRYSIALAVEGDLCSDYAGDGQLPPLLQETDDLKLVAINLGRFSRMWAEGWSFVAVNVSAYRAVLKQNDL